jgi:hypothetical protein
MSGVFQNIDPPPPSSPLVREEDTLAGWRGGWGGVNILEDARHSSVLYICKYFVGECVHFSFNKCNIYTHDGASAKFSINSHETCRS